MKDKTDEVLGKDMALKHVSIDHDVVMEHFEKTLGWFLERDFLSYSFPEYLLTLIDQAVDMD